MEKNRGVIRELLKYEFELGHSVKEAIENINRAKGVGTVAQRTAYEWYSKFKSGNLTIEDNPRAGRPREVDRAAVVNAVEEHPSMTTRMLADDFDCSFKEIALILHDAGKKWLKSQWVPKELTTAQKRNRVQIATRLLDRARQTPFFDHIVTCDENSTYSDRWSTGCVEKSSKQSKKCAKVLRNSSNLRTENGTAAESINLKNNGRK